MRCVIVKRQWWIHDRRYEYNFTPSTMYKVFVPQDFPGETHQTQTHLAVDHYLVQYVIQYILNLTFLSIIYICEIEAFNVIQLYKENLRIQCLRVFLGTPVYMCSRSTQYGTIILLSSERNCKTDSYPLYGESIPIRFNRKFRVVVPIECDALQSSHATSASVAVFLGSNLVLANCERFAKVISFIHPKVFMDEGGDRERMTWSDLHDLANGLTKITRRIPKHHLKP